MMWKETAVA